MTKPVTDDGAPRKAGLRVEARVLLVVAAVVLLWFAVYTVTATERAGMTMLLLTAAMAALMGGYLVVQARRRADPAEVGPGIEDHYLPHASVWPFALGVGAVLVANGLALGLWAVVPGAALIAYGVWGYARQSRRRD